MGKYVVLRLLIPVSFALMASSDTNFNNEQLSLTITGMPPILNSFTNCVQEIITDQIYLDLQELSSSYILSTLSESTRNQTAQKNSSAFALRYSNCLVTTISISEDTSYFWLYFAASGRMPLHPRYQIVLTNELLTEEGEMRIYELIHITNDETAPPTYWLKYRASSWNAEGVHLSTTLATISSGEYLKYGYVKATYARGFCDARADYTDFDCDPVTCYHVMKSLHSELTRSGYNSTWAVQKLIGEQFYFPPNATAEINPFSNRNSALLHQATMTFLLAGTVDPRILCSRNQQSNAFPSIRPEVTSALRRMDVYGEVFLTGGTTDYKFITTSTKNVYNKWTFRFLDSLNIEVWTGILFCLISLILSEALLECLVGTGRSREVDITEREFRNPCKLILKSLYGVTFWPSLLDQPWAVRRIKRCKTRNELQEKRNYRNILAIPWVISALVITLHYKAVLKSESVGGYQVDSEINFLAEAMEKNFSVTYITSRETCGRYFRNQTTMLLSQFCQRAIDEARECDLRRKLAERLDAFDREKKNQLIFWLYDQISYTCIDSIITSLKNGGRLRQRSVFLTTAEEFPYYLNFFKEKLKENPEVCVAGNIKFKDTLLETQQGYYITDGLHEDMQYVRNRMQILLHSGIFWFWEKWERINIIDKSGLSKFREALEGDGLKTEYKPVSLIDISFLSVLYVCIVGWLAGFTSFGLENALARKFKYSP